MLFRKLMPRFDAAKDDGGGDGLEAIKALGKDMAKAVTKTEDTAKKVEKIAEDIETMKVDSEKDVKRLAAQAARVETVLAKGLGKSGAQDWLMDMAKFLRGAFLAKHRLAIPEDELMGGATVKSLVTKAAADFTTTTDATAGYLVPQIFLPGIRELMDIYGNFYPKVTKITAPAGVSVPMHKDAANPVATWRGTQVTGITEEATPMSFGRETLVSILCGSFIQIANELLNAPGVNFSAVAVVRMIRAIVRKAEYGMIAGTTGAGEPSDGLIADATDQGTIATMTFANFIVFLQRCIADNPWAFDTTKNVIIMTPQDAVALASQAVGSSELTGMLVWGNPRMGVPTTLMGYELVVHPGADNSTAKHVLLGDPSTISLVEDAGFSVDISGEAGNSFTENASILRVLNHFDWDLGQTVEWHKSVVTV